ncbi:MAG: hypothetical protein JXB49_07075 [Bacteroidales bacterium]|nr:hypothetical protein [Bacteroidales bacterium]
MGNLVSPVFRKLGLIITIIGIIILVVLNFLNIQYDEADAFDKLMHHNHMIIIFGLMMLTFSKEKIDDEGVQKIRYFVAKFCLRLLVVMIPTYIVVTDLDKVNFSIYPILYIIEGILLLYQILFRVGIKFSLKAMYSDSISGDKAFIILFIVLLISIVTLILSVFDHVV